jgi:hypothetical protein
MIWTEQNSGTRAWLGEMDMKTWLTAVIGLCACGAAQAQEDGGRQAAFGALKYRTLAAEAAIDAVLHPPGSAPDGDPRIYFGSAAAFEVRRLSASIDGGAPAVQEPGRSEAQAVAGTGNLLWLEGAALPDGKHQVHAVVQALDNTKPDAGVQTFEADAEVDFEEDGAALELSLAGSTPWRKSARWRGRTAASSPAAPTIRACVTPPT